jgi:hypothetical protein
MIVFDTNLKVRAATTQYQDFEYNSMVKFAGKYFAANSTGLHAISDDYSDDNGTNIIAFFEMATTDFGVKTEKRLRSLYIGYSAANDLTIEISTELGYVGTYTVPANTEGLKTRKVPLSRGVRGRYFTFRVYSNGIPFAVDRIDVLPIIRGHGFDRS